MSSEPPNSKTLLFSQKAGQKTRVATISGFERTQLSSFLENVNQTGSELFSSCFECYKADLIDKAQCEKLMEIAQAMSEVSYRVLQGDLKLKEGIITVSNNFKELAGFIQQNLPAKAAVIIGKGLLVTLPFLNPSMQVGVVGMSMFLKSNIGKRLQKEIQKHLKIFGENRDTLESVVNATLAQASNQADILRVDQAVVSVDRVSEKESEAVLNDFKKSLIVSFVLGVNPIAAALAASCFECYKAGLMNETVLKEFVGICSEIGTVPYQVIRDRDIEKGIAVVTEGFAKLAKFMEKSLEPGAKATVIIGNNLLARLPLLNPIKLGAMGMGILLKGDTGKILQAGIQKCLKDLAESTTHLSAVVQRSLGRSAEPEPRNPRPHKP